MSQQEDRDREELYLSALKSVLSSHRLSDAKEIVADVLDLSVEEYGKDEEFLNNLDYYDGEVEEMELDFG